MHQTYDILKNWSENIPIKKSKEFLKEKKIKLKAKFLCYKKSKQSTAHPQE